MPSDGRKSFIRPRQLSGQDFYVFHPTDFPFSPVRNQTPVAATPVDIFNRFV
jgi:hypothetical protein